MDDKTAVCGFTWMNSRSRIFHGGTKPKLVRGPKSKAIFQRKNRRVRVGYGDS